METNDYLSTSGSMRTLTLTIMLLESRDWVAAIFAEARQVGCFSR